MQSTKCLKIQIIVYLLSAGRQSLAGIILNINDPRVSPRKIEDLLYQNNDYFEVGQHGLWQLTDEGITTCELLLSGQLFETIKE